MADRCLLYYITDRTAFSGDEPTRRRLLLEKIREAAVAGIDYIQLREKDLSTRDLESLAREAVKIMAELRTSLLINSRTDVALAVGADGVHLRSDDVYPQEASAVWQRHHECGAGAPACANSPRDPVIAVSCHSPAEVLQAAASAVTFAVFAPVFEKKGSKPAGLSILHEACVANIPVLALGGITLTSAPSCLEAGSAGIAAIRLFQDNNIAEVVKQLCPNL